MLKPIDSFSSISVITPRSIPSPMGVEPSGTESSIETGNEEPISISASIIVFASVPLMIPSTFLVCTSANPMSRIALMPA